MAKTGKYQEYGDMEQLHVVTDLSDVVQLIIHNGGLVQYIYLEPEPVSKLIRQLQAWEALLGGPF